MKVCQKLIILERVGGKYYNFFNSPDSVGSLESYLCTGWFVLKMDIDTDNERGWVLLQFGYS